MKKTSVELTDVQRRTLLSMLRDRKDARGGEWDALAAALTRPSVTRFYRGKIEISIVDTGDESFDAGSLWDDVADKLQDIANAFANDTPAVLTTIEICDMREEDE